MKNLRCIALVATATAAAALAPMVTTASADAASVLMVRGTQVWPVYSPGTAEWDSQQTDLMGEVCGGNTCSYVEYPAGMLRPRSRRASPLWTPP